MAEPAQKPRRPPTSDAQKAKLREAQLNYIRHDPRWEFHRAKIAVAQRDPKQRATLSAAVKAYRDTDPRWPDHRVRLYAAAEATNKITLLPEEIEAVLAMRKKGRTFEYIGEELCVSDRVIRRELRARGIPTSKVKADRRAKPTAQGHWRCFDPP